VVQEFQRLMMGMLEEDENTDETIDTLWTSAERAAQGIAEQGINADVLSKVQYLVLPPPVGTATTNSLHWKSLASSIYYEGKVTGTISSAIVLEELHLFFTSLLRESMLVGNGKSCYVGVDGLPPTKRNATKPMPNLGWQIASYGRPQ
jgi:hypothetical protein